GDREHRCPARQRGAGGRDPGPNPGGQVGSTRRDCGRGGLSRLARRRLRARARTGRRRRVAGSMTRPQTTQTRSGSPSAIAKLVAVAEALTEQRRLSRIANTAGLPISTVHRILQELVAHGWVREGEEHDYVLGPGLMRLAARAADDSDLARAAR